MVSFFREKEQIGRYNQLMDFDLLQFFLSLLHLFYRNSREKSLFDAVKYSVLSHELKISKLLFQPK